MIIIAFQSDYFGCCEKSIRGIAQEQKKEN